MVLKSATGDVGGRGKGLQTKITQGQLDVVSRSVLGSTGRVKQVRNGFIATHGFASARSVSVYNRSSRNLGGGAQSGWSYFDGARGTNKGFFLQEK